MAFFRERNLTLFFISFYRIILAGSGKVTTFFATPNMRRKTFFTLVICDRQLQEEAKAFAEKNNTPWYPYEAIPDFIMQV